MVQCSREDPICVTGWLQSSVTTHACTVLLEGVALPNCAEFAVLKRNTNWVFSGALYCILVKWLPLCRLVANRQNTKNKRNLKNTTYVFHYLSYKEESGETFSNLICGNKMPTRCNRRFLLQILLLAISNKICIADLIACNK